MKVVHIVESFASGTFNFLSDLTQNMPECEFIIIHGKREETPLDYPRYFPTETQFIFWEHAARELSIKRDILAFIELINILRKLSDIDVIHLHSSKAGFLGRIVARLLGVHHKVLYTPHGASFLRQDVSFLKHRLFVLFEKIGAFFAGRVIACSESEANAFAELGIHAEYINNSVNIDIANIPSTASHGTLTIATIGRISYQKNPTLFNEIAHSYKSNPAIKFLWIGDGELRDVLTAQNISVTGWLPKDKALACLIQADIYLSTSLWEGLPISVLQAMCMQKPLVLSDCIGNRDLMSDNGFICRRNTEFIEAIDYLIGHDQARQEFGKKSRTLYETEFSPERMVNAYLTLYKAM